MAHADHTRDPCPYVILNDFGGAFAMGAVGGTIWHGIKGSRNSPRVSGAWTAGAEEMWLRKWRQAAAAGDEGRMRAAMVLGQRRQRAERMPWHSLERICRMSRPSALCARA